MSSYPTASRRAPPRAILTGRRPPSRPVDRRASWSWEGRVAKRDDLACSCTGLREVGIGRAFPRCRAPARRGRRNRSAALLRCAAHGVPQISCANPSARLNRSRHRMIRGEPRSNDRRVLACRHRMMLAVPDRLVRGSTRGPQRGVAHPRHRQLGQRRHPGSPRLLDSDVFIPQQASAHASPSV
jgi:hypothetical protein